MIIFLAKGGASNLSYAPQESTTPHSAHVATTVPLQSFRRLNLSPSGSNKPPVSTSAPIISFTDIRATPGRCCEGTPRGRSASGMVVATPAFPLHLRALLGTTKPPQQRARPSNASTNNLHMIYLKRGQSPAAQRCCSMYQVYEMA